ncbi:tRNA ligase class I [Ostertagia ostertagi]
MLSRRASSCLRRCSTKAKSSFDIDVVTKDRDTRVEWAAANYRNSGKELCMVLPPPNVTGKLHLGHALTVTIEDTLCRHHRIKGGVARWIPGFDHAGIATQVVVERELWKKKRLRRDQLSRQDFVEECRQWSEMNSAAIRKQLNILGATLDWKSAYYTLNDKFSSAVTEAFVRLHEDGLIHRDKRIVHWCPSLQSSISDQEVSHIDLSSSTKIVVPSSTGGKREVEVGAMYCVKYPMDDSDRFIPVATTRPETMFADVAIAVHPDDSRFSQLVGKFVRHPLCQERKLPIIADESVQMDKGTGALKVTPSHDALDWEIASRHQEEILRHDQAALTRSCIDIHGKLNQTANEFAGLDRFDARAKIIEKLDSCGLFQGTLKHDGQVKLCSRTGDVVEPRLTDQWFMNTEGLYEEAAQAIKILPAIYEQKLFDWLSNKDPWCLSRQLLWGHRIPAYRSERYNWDLLMVFKLFIDSTGEFGMARLGIQPIVAASGCYGDRMGHFRILGRLNDYCAQCNSRDCPGKTMSKSLVTATSAISTQFPDGIVRAAASDALRFALLRHDLLASDIPLKIADLSSEGLRFCNKLWNMVAYAETVIENSHTMKDVDSDHPADEWILSRLAGALEQVDKHMSQYMPHLAFMELQNFILGSLCDVYLDSYRSDFVSRLQRLLKKSEERSDQFQKKAEKYEAIVLRDRHEGKVKPHIIDKNERKARQARGVANGALEEAARIRVLLEEMST